MNPFEHNYSQNKFYQQLLVEENDGIQTKINDFDAFKQENLDLKRQIVLMQQQMEDKDRTIRLLQQQMVCKFICKQYSYFLLINFRQSIQILITLMFHKI